jgi:hypothetical protein
MFAHERSLVDKYQGKPFALLGVNADASREQLRAAQEKDQLNWRSWWDGPSGPITMKWKVEGLPSLFLVDHKGVIRWTSVGVPDLNELDERIAELVQGAQPETVARSQ